MFWRMMFWRKLFNRKPFAPWARQPKLRAPQLRVESLEDRLLLSSAPTVVSTNPAAIFTAPATTVAASSGKTIKITYSTTVVGGGAASNYDLRNDGPDGIPNTADDIVVPLTAAYSGSTATLTFSAALPASTSPYQLTVFDNITDTSGNKLDGDADGVPGGNFVRTFTVVPGAATKLVVSGFPATTAGTTQSFIVTADDAFGNVATNYTGTVHFTSSDSQASLPADYTFTSADGGGHTFSGTLFSAGTRTLTATDTVTSTITGKESSILVSPAAASSFVVSTATSTTAGNSLGVAVTAKDPYGNVATGYLGTVHFTSTDAQASLPADYAFAPSDAGTHTFIAALKTAGSRTITATDTVTSTITGKQSSIQVSPAAASVFTVSTATSTTAGSPLSVVVTAKDLYSNVATGYLGTVHFSSTDTQAVLPADYTFTGGDSGAHTFSATLVTAGSRTITATDTLTSTITGKQSAIQVSPAAVNSLGFSSVPSGATAGTSFNVTLTAFDAYANVATSYTGTVHFTSADAQAVLPADYAFTSTDAGSKTFAVTLKTSGTMLLTATDTVTSSFTAQANVPVSAAAAKTLTVSTASSTTAGSPLSVTVTAKDTYGNVATGYTGTVHFTSTDTQASLPADYAFTGGDSGAHTFSATLVTAGSWAVTATDTVTSTITGKQSAIQVSPAAANSLAFNGVPAGAVAGTSFNVTLTALDAYANVATSYLGTVHFTSTDTQAVLPADYTFAGADAGRKVFSVTLKTSGTPSLTATDTVTSTITGQANVPVSAAAAKTFTVSTASSSTAGSPLSVIVTAKDTYGNVGTSYVGTVHFTSTDAQAVLPADYTFSGSDAGTHTFSATFFSAGSRTLTATDTVTSTITGKQTGIQVNPAAASAFVVTTTTTTTAGSAINVTVTAKDASGNVATGYFGTVHFTSTDAQAALPTDYTFTAADAGIHTFSVTLKTAATQTITATDAGTSTITGKVSGIVVSAGAMAAFAVGVPTKSATGAPFNDSVTAVDAYGNLVASYTGTVHFTSSDLQASLPADYTYTVADAGAHTFTATFMTAGAQSLTATDSAGGFTGSATFTPSWGRYSFSTNTIYVTGPVTVALSDIAATVSGAPLQLVDPVNHIWFLKANLVLQQGATLNLHGTSIGGDVDQLRLMSDNVAGSTNNIIKISADWGDIDINTTHITSWDEAVNGPDTEVGTYGRSYIQVRSSLAADGVTPLQARMDIANSDIGYLGYDNSEAYGLSWKVIGNPGQQTTDAYGNPTFPLYQEVRVFGNVTNNHIHNMFFGVFTFGSLNQQFIGNEVDHDVGYGLDFHDDSDFLLVQNNYVHDNGYGDPSEPGVQFDGIITSKRCDHAQYIDNVSAYNAQNGLFFHDQGNESLMQGNQAIGNGLAGIVLFASRSDVIQNNISTGNLIGLKLVGGSSSNTVEGNDLGENSVYGINLLTGDDPDVLGDGRQHGNVFLDNNVHDNGSFALRVVDSDDTVFQGNTFSNNDTPLSFENSRRTILDGNVFQAGQVVSVLTSSTQFTATATIKNEPSVNVQVDDALSQVTLQDAGGAVFDVAGTGVRTTVTTGGSSVVLKQSNIGLNEQLVLTRNLQVATDPTQNVLIKVLSWSITGDQFKSWSAQASSTSEWSTFTVGDFAPNTLIAVTRNGAPLTTVTSDATGQIQFTDTSGTTGPVTYGSGTPAGSIGISGLPTSTTAGTPQSVTLTIFDASGNVATGYRGTVHFTSTDPLSAQPNDYTFTANDAGTHTFTVTFKTAGIDSLTVADTANANLSGQASLGVSQGQVSGFGVTAVSKIAAASNFSVTVTAQDQYGNLVPGYLGTVHFSSTDLQAALPTDYTFTAADQGSHTFSATLYTAANQTITAKDTATPTVSGLSSPIRVTPLAATTLAVTSMPSSSTASSSFNFTVTAYDTYGNLATGYTGTVHFTSSDPLAVLPPDYTFTTADAGNKTLTATFKTSGVQSLAVADTSGGIYSGQGSLTVTPAGAKSLTVANFTSPATAGTPQSFNVTAVDSNGNPVPSYTGTIHFTSTDLSAALPVDYTFTAADAGTHTFSATLFSVGSRAITATDTVTSTIQGKQLAIQVQPGAVANFLVSGFPTPVAAGTAGTITVTAKDAFGNLATNYTGTVHLASTDAAASLPADYAFTTADAGAHTFSVTLFTAGSQTLTASDTANPAATGRQSAIRVNALAASTLTISGYPPSTTAGTPHNFEVRLRDIYGNLATGYTGTVHFTSSDVQAALPANYTFTAADGGDKIFSATLKTAGTQTLTVADTVNASLTATQSGILVTAAANAAKSFVVTGFGSPATAGVADELQVTALDTFGNVATNYTGTVHFTSTDLSAALPADYTFTIADAGAHTFTATLFTAGLRTIQAIDTADATILGKQQFIQVMPTAASNLVVTGFVTPVAAGTPASVTVTAKDTYGNVTSNYTGTVSVTSSDPSASLPGAYTFTTADAGSHTFSATLFTAGSQTLTATDTSNATVTGKQSAIRVNPLAATTLSVTGYPSATTAGASGNFSVSAYDTYGNLVTGYTGTVHFTSTDPIAVLPADYTFSTADAGKKIFPATFKTAGAQSLSATDTANSGLTATQTGIQVAASATAKGFAVTGFTNPIAAGQASTFTVTAVDAYGNVSAGYLGTVHFTTTDLNAQVQLPADYTFTAADQGSHTFSATLISTGLRTIQATDTTDATILGKQQFIQVVPAAVSSFVLNGFQTPIGAGVPSTFTVTAKDLYGNVDFNYTGTIHFTSTDPLATLPDDYTFTTADAGMQTFSATLFRVGSQTIAATDTTDTTITGQQSAIKVKAVADASFAVAAYPGSTIAGTSHNFIVQILDVFGNVDADYTGTVHFTSDDPQAVLPADYTFTSADEGDKIFAATFKTAGAHALIATDVTASSLTGNQAGIVVVPASAKGFAVSGFTNPVTAGQASTFTVTSVDPYGNVARDYAGTVHFTTTDLSSQVQLPADYTFTTADQGSHTFSATLISTGLRTIQAADTSDPTILGKQQFIQVNGAAAAYFQLTIPASVTSGAPFDLTVSAKDVFGNFTSNYLGTVHFTSSRDLSALFPPDYAFTLADAGTHTFSLGGGLFLPGVQDIIATDTANAMLTGKSSALVTPGSYLWLPATNTIYINGITTTLSAIAANLPTAPLTLVDPVNHIWLLDADLLLQNGATLNLHGTSIGGDVNQLRLRSNNRVLADGTQDPTNTIWVRADYGNVSIDTTSITSWDEDRNAPDTNPGIIPPRNGDDDNGSPADTAAHQRSYLDVRSSFAADGVTPLESRMDINNSDIGYLGSHTTEGYGLSWKALGLGPVVHSKLHVYGNVTNSHIHNNFFGAFIYGGFGMEFLHNEVDHNIWYGLDPHDDTDYTDMEYNYTHDNGTHGIILSRRCDNNIISHNISTDNVSHGIMLHRSSNNNIVSDNVVTDNGDTGIAIYESFGNTVTGNTVQYNLKGIRFSMGAAFNTISGNDLGFNTFDGIDFLTGNDAPDLSVDADRRPHDNRISNNTIHDSGQYAIRVTNGDNNTFVGNTLTNESQILVATGVNNLFSANTLPASLVLSTTGSTTYASNTLVQNQPSANVLVDSFSTVTFGDAVGSVLDTGALGLGTTVSPGGSQFVLTKAAIGTQPATILSRELAAGVAPRDPAVTIAPSGTWKTGVQESWVTQAGSATQSVTYNLTGLTPDNFYSITKNGVFLTAAVASDSGTLTFADASGSTSAVTYQLQKSNLPNLPPVQASNVSYSSSSNTLTITGAVSATLSQLLPLLPSAAAGALVLIDPVQHIWELKANLVLAKGAALILQGSSLGGDVNQLRLKSNNSAALGSVASIVANWGDIFINGTSVTSWDEAANGPDTEIATFKRAFIEAISVLDKDGVTPRPSYMNINNSTISYLGYSSSNPGLHWQVNSTNPAVLQTLHVFGNVSNSHISYNYYGVSTKGADSGMYFTGDEIDHSISNAMNIKFYSSQVDIENDNIHDNGGTGLNISTNSSGVVVRNNTFQNNTGSAIKLQTACNGVQIQGNQILGNKQYGIDIVTCDSTVVTGNTIDGNKYGVKVEVNSGMNTITHNDISGNTSAGIQVATGSGTGLNADGSPRTNVFSGNAIHDNAGSAIAISSADTNLFSGNSIYGTANQTISIKSANDNVFTGNTLSSNTTIATSGTATATSRTRLVDQDKVVLKIGSFSSAILSSSSGGVFKAGASTAATTVTPTTSSITLTSANFGSSPSLVSLRHLGVTVDSSSATIDSSGWSSTAGSTKTFVVQAGSVTQSSTYTFGDLIANAVYTIKKNGVPLFSVTADANGFASFTDVAGTLAAVTYTIIAATPG
jgi:parallel beta-helix repeat protein